MAVVIGANGFLGARLGATLGQRGDVTLVGRRGGVGIDYVVDLRDESECRRLLKLVRGQTVYYCAAVGGREAAEQDPWTAFKVNSEIPGLLASQAGRFIYFSSDYVFDRPGQYTESSSPCPAGTYACSKAEGERSVLAASDNSLIVRVSGLFDDNGTRNGLFSSKASISAADNRRSRPTYVPDLIKVLDSMVYEGTSGIRNVCGPDLLTTYEFWQLVSLKTKIMVEPSLAKANRFKVDVKPSPGVRLRSPSELLLEKRTTPTSRCSSVIVSDCIGVVLSARSWLKNDPEFWELVESDVERALYRYGLDAIVDAYTMNPAIWPQIKDLPTNAQVILANNGPWISFSRWVRKFGFDRIFDEIVNSERNGLIKPEKAFRDYILGIARGAKIRLIDDRKDIVDRALEWGWVGIQTTRSHSLPLEQWLLPSNSTFWSN